MGIRGDDTSQAEGHRRTVQAPMDDDAVVYLVVSQAEDVGWRIDHADLKGAASGPNATNRSALYSTRKT